mgnify:CR=1 FL=1
MSREAMQMALDALESLQAWPETPENFKRFRAIEALRARLAQPDVPETAFGETEPVAWMHNFIDDVIIKNRPTDITCNAGRWTALYTAPPQRKQQQAMRLYKSVERLALQADEDTDESIEWLCGEHGGMFKLYEKYFSPQQRERVQFPMMLRKMWSGSEVQSWLDENVNKEKNA